MTDPSGHKCVGDDPGCLPGEGGTGKKTIPYQNVNYCDNHPGACGPKTEPKVYGPERPNFKTANTSFQMFEATNPYNYAQAAEESYTDFPGGGDPKYYPQIHGVTTSEVHPANPADVMGLFNDALIGAQATFQQPPYDQQVSISYTDQSIIGISVRNESKAVVLNRQINYLLTITSVDHSFALQSTTSTTPGQPGEFPLPENLSTSNWPGGVNIQIHATTLCASACIVDPNALVFQGATSFNFNP